MKTLVLTALLALAAGAHAEVEEVMPIRIGAAGFAKSDTKGKLSAGPLIDYLQAGLG